MSGLQAQERACSLSQPSKDVAAAETKPKKRICCACPDTKKLRDECIVENGESACTKWIEAHRMCLRANRKGYIGQDQIKTIYVLFNHVDNGMMHVDIDDYSMFQAVLNSQDFPTDVEVFMSTTQPWGFPDSKGSRSSSTEAVWNTSMETPQSWDFFSGLAFPQTSSYSSVSSSTMVLPQAPDIVMVPAPPPSRSFKLDGSGSSSKTLAAEVVPSAQADFLKSFKRFETVEDFSDHHYASKGKASKQHSKNWVKKVQADWQILENDLPETIFVRACESRMDLLRAVIIGAEGTPYHDGLFFFDIQFPDSYPSAPPKVHYHSGGLRINPNLYNCGKVCLSLLGTWTENTSTDSEQAL
ncbi:hypothetical protein F2Q68_00043670, partial [Brassica cretica]